MIDSFLIIAMIVGLFLASITFEAPILLLMAFCVTVFWLLVECLG